MKKEFLTIGCAVASVLFANAATEYLSENALGMLPVTKEAGKAMLAAPFVGYDGSAISAANVVSTANLANGDKLYIAQNGQYQCWTLTSGSWEASDVITKSGVVPGTAAASSSVARGDGIWLDTQVTTAYLMGQQTSADSVSLKCYKGWNLIGNSSVANTKTLEVISDPKAGDIVIFSDGATSTRYQYGTTSKKWRNMDTKVSYSASDITLPVGKAFWYKASASCTIEL